MRIKDHTTTCEDHDRARRLRREATPCEQKLWLALRGEARKHGLKFRRQHPLHPFIVDFACLKAKLAVEIDGYFHDVRSDYDAMRDRKIEQMGYKVLRYTNEDVAEHLQAVVDAVIRQALILVVKAPAPTEQHLSSIRRFSSAPPPSRGGGFPAGTGVS